MMMKRLGTWMGWTGTMFFVVIGIAAPLHAALQITEIMYDPLSNNDSMYEYVEVRNTGASAVDLNGAFTDDIGDTTDPASPVTAAPNIANTTTANTIIPAGGVGVIYDAFLATGSPANFDDSKFRTLWGLSPTVPLIGADFFPSLNNTSPNATPYTDGFGIWANQSDYNLDVDRAATPQPNGHVLNYNHALTSISYQTTAPWPTPTAGHSIQWSGNGDINNGANWVKSATGVNGATTSTQVTVVGATNSSQDIGNPGITSGTPTAGKFLVTEVMFNPRSTEPNWEWVEVYNNTGATINFGTTPYVIDDFATPHPTAANITSGSIPNGTSAILIDGDPATITPADFQGAWGSLNVIPVTTWPQLNNTAAGATDGGGDTFGIWPSLAAFQTDQAVSSTTFTHAAASLNYDISDATHENGWPRSDGNGSIYLPDIGADPSLGGNWLLSNTSDGVSFTANGLSGTVVLDPGGEEGSPGTFNALPAGVAGDYNGDGAVDALDYTYWRDHFGATFTLQNRDPSNSGVVNAQDYTYWTVHFGGIPGAGSLGGGAVPEPASVALLAIGLVGLVAGRRRFGH